MITEITPEVLADLKTPRDVRLSPSGKQVVYALRSFWVKKEHVVSSLWMADVGSELSARQLTQGNFNDASPQFSPDGHYISFISDRAKQGKASAVYLLPVNGGEALPLTSTENESGVNGYKWSPDSKSVAFISADESSEEKKKKIKDKDDPKVYGEDWPYGRLRLISVGSKDVTTLFSEDSNVVDLAWSPDGDRLAFTVSKTPELNSIISAGTIINIMSIKDKTAIKVCNYPIMIDGFVWHQSDLIWTGKYDLDRFQSSNCLYTVAAKPDNKGVSRKAYGFDSCVIDFRRCKGGIVVHVAKGLSDQLQVLDSTIVYDEEHHVRSWDANIEGDAAVLAIMKSSAATPDEVFSVVKGKVCQLSQHNKDFAALEIGTTTPYEHTADDGTPLDGVICLPKSLAKLPVKDRQPHKTVVLVHGGPYARVSVDFELQLMNWSSWLLALDFVVLCPNYRGGQGHGNAYASAVRGNIAASYQDVIALTKKGIADGIFEEKNVAIAGWSQGGYMGYLAVTRDSTFHFRAAICGAGISDWDTMAQTTDIYTFETELSGMAPWLNTVSGTDSRLGSPIYHMQDIHTPVLILHGEEDQRVPVTQAIAFHRGMLARGKECEMIIYPREGHCWPEPCERNHMLHMLKKIRAFLEKHMA